MTNWRAEAMRELEAAERMWAEVGPALKGEPGERVEQVARELAAHIRRARQALDVVFLTSGPPEPPAFQVRPGPLTGEGDPMA